MAPSLPLPSTPTTVPTTATTSVLASDSPGTSTATAGRTLRGGYGIYYGRIPNANILQTYLESGTPTSQENVTNIYPDTAGPIFPNVYSSYSALISAGAAAGYAPVPSAAYFGPHVQNPQVHEADLAVEQDLGHNFTLGVTYMMSLGRELLTGFDQNLNYSMTGLGHL